MKPQFSIRTMLLVVAVAGVWMGMPFLASKAFQVLESKSDTPSPAVFILLTALMAPLWLPCLFVGYALGRQSLTAWIIVAMVVAEALAFCALPVLFPLMKTIR